MIDIQLPFDKLDAVVNPTPSDDQNYGFSAGSKWLNTLTGQWFFCRTAPVGGAQWDLMDSSSSSSSLSNSGFPLRETFISKLGGSAIEVFNRATGGAPSPTQGTPEAYHPGIRRMLTGSGVSTGQCVDSLTGAVGGGGYVLSDGITDVQIVMKTIQPAVPLTLTDSLQSWFGISNAATFTPTRAIYWLYDYAGYGGDNFWRIVVIGTGGTYTVTTPVQWSLASSVWHRFGLRVYGGPSFPGTQKIEYYYGNDTSAYSLLGTITQATLTTAGVTIPTGSAITHNLSWAIRKPATTTVQREQRVDFVSMDKIFL